MKIRIAFGLCIVFMLAPPIELALQRHGPNAVRVNKCCEKYEILYDQRCTKVNSSVAGIFYSYITFYTVRMDKIYYVLFKLDPFKKLINKFN